MILFWICVLLWVNVIKRASSGRKRRRPVSTQPVVETEEDLRKAQATYDVEFYREQLDRYYEMLWDAEDKLSKASDKVARDSEMNRYGGVIPEKLLVEHTKELEKLRSRVVTLNNRIHTTEKCLRKAEHLLYVQ